MLYEFLESNRVSGVAYGLLGALFLAGSSSLICSEPLLDEIKSAASVSQASITSGIVRYDRRVWLRKPAWSDTVNELVLEEGRIETASLPAPTWEDTNVLTFRREDDQVLWKLYRENTRDLDDTDPKTVLEFDLDYLTYTTVRDGIVSRRVMRKDRESWDYFLSKRKANEYPALNGDHEQVWEFGIAKILDATNIPDQVEKVPEITVRGDGTIEVVQRYSRALGYDKFQRYRILYDPVNQGRFSRYTTFIVPLLPEGKDLDPMVGLDIFFDQFADFNGVRIPTRKVWKNHALIQSPDGTLAFGLTSIDEIILTDVQLNVPVSDADLVVGMEEGDHVYDFLEEGTVKEFIVGQEEDE